MTDEFDPTAKILKPAWVCRVTGCPPATLRKWRNEFGLLKRGNTERKWNWYSVLETCIVRLAVIMFEHGLTAKDAIGFTQLGLEHRLELLLKGQDASPIIAFHAGGTIDPNELVFDVKAGKDVPASELPTTSTLIFMEPSKPIGDLMKSRQGILILVDLREIIRHVRDELGRSEVRKLVFGAIAAGLSPDPDPEDGK